MPQKSHSESGRVWNGRSDVKKLALWIADDRMCREPIESGTLFAHEPSSHRAILRPVSDQHVYVLVALSRLWPPTLKGHLECTNQISPFGQPSAKSREVSVVAGGNETSLGCTFGRSTFLILQAVRSRKGVSRGIGVLGELACSLISESTRVGVVRVYRTLNG